MEGENKAEVCLGPFSKEAKPTIMSEVTTSRIVLMRVVCVHLPRRGPSDVAGYLDTMWEVFPAKLFMHQLDDICETIWEPFSMELYSTSGTVYVCFAGSHEIIEFLITGLYSWMPDCEVHDVEDYASTLDHNTVAVSCDMRLWRSDIYPLLSYKNIINESLQPILGGLSQLPQTDTLLIQLIVRPLRDGPRLHLTLAGKRALDKAVNLFRTRTWLKQGLPVNNIQKAKEKCTQHMLLANYRISAYTHLSPKASARERNETSTRLTGHLRTMSDIAKMYNTVDENRLFPGKTFSGPTAVKRIMERRFDRPYRLSTLEAATMLHPPTLAVLPNTAQVLSKKAPAPPLLPVDTEDKQTSFFGLANFRDVSVPFGIKRFDRRRHLYTVGKSGSGKSCMMQLLVQNDINNGFGCAVLDPHGDLIDDILRLVPQHRTKDVVIFDPSDTNFPPSFNPMLSFKPELNTRVALSFLDSFKRVFGSDWSEKMDHVLRYAMLGLLAVPGSNILSLRRMLTDDDFRTDIVRRATDESVKRFWLREFVNRRREFEEGPISRLLNRLDELLSTETMRNILGQSANLFDFRHFMDTRKIVLLKISKGVLGSDNAQLLGSLLIWKIYEAAMSRADIPAADRQDFYFYVDEFQNFASESFGEILSESRKYRLCLTFAHQYIGQLPDSIRATVFGNVANILSFRVGADDAGLVSQEFKPRFGSEDVLNLPLRNFYLKMSIDGAVQEAFSGSTLDLIYPPEEQNFSRDAIAYSRSQYCLPISKVREEVQRNMVTSSNKLGRATG